MKRVLLMGAILAAGAMPAASSAESAGRESVDRGGADLRIEFVLRSVGGEPRQVRDFEFKNFTVTCNSGGPVDLRGKIDKMRINDNGRFDGNARRKRGKVHVEGEVKSGGDRVIGTLKASGKFGQARGCDTKVAWEAS